MRRRYRRGTEDRVLERSLEDDRGRLFRPTGSVSCLRLRARCMFTSSSECVVETYVCVIAVWKIAS